ncbi:MAG: SDR family oxidoreductase [Candidatus Lokiarchaeota archaeon]|nr:SDR family oxidoreductase [Candidatus Lokiarchaeota archaeon]
MSKEKLIKKQPFKGKWAIISGGSKGIGKATAKIFVQLGGNVCIVARTLETLNVAAEEIKSLRVNENQLVEVISCDMSNMEQVERLFKGHIKNFGVPDYSFNFVGISYPDYTDKLTIEDYKFHMDTNYFGQLNSILTILPYYMERKEGYFINMSSLAGYIGLMGYAAYTPTKFAIVGLSEVLRNEYKQYNIKVSIIYPPDTDTFGLHEEAKTRPEELNIIAEKGGLMQPDEVAEIIIKGVLKEKLYIHAGSSKIYWRIMRLFPKLVHKFTDSDLKKARKKLGKLI